MIGNLQPRRQSRRSVRVVRKKLADGSTKEYRYESHKPRAGRNPPGSVGALIEAYLRSPEWDAKRRVSKDHFLIYARELDPWRPLPVNGIRRRLVLALRDELAATRGPSTANRFITVTSVLLSWAVEREWIEVNPLLRIKRLPGGHLRAWNAEEYTRIVPRLPEPLRRAAVLASYTGQRRSDLIAMKWSQYDGASISLKQQKTGAELVIPAAYELRLELEAWRAGVVAPHPERTILTTHTGLPWEGRYLSHLFWREVVKIEPEAKGLNVHGFRKLCAATLIELGCSEHEAAAITGHDDMSVLRLY